MAISRCFFCLCAGEYRHETYSDTSLSRTHYTGTSSLSEFESEILRFIFATFLQFEMAKHKEAIKIAIS